MRLASTHPDRKYRRDDLSRPRRRLLAAEERDKARETWQAGRARFPDEERLRMRLTSPDNVVSDTLSHELDARVRVDTSLRELFAD